LARSVIFSLERGFSSEAINRNGDILVDVPGVTTKDDGPAAPIIDIDVGGGGGIGGGGGALLVPTGSVCVAGGSSEAVVGGGVFTRTIAMTSDDLAHTESS